MKGHGASMLNIRLQPADGVPRTKQELREVIDYIRDHGAVPAGWKFSAIEWQNPKAAFAGWKTGTVDDLEKFLPMLRKISGNTLVDAMRAAEVEKRSTMGPKARAKLEKEVGALKRIVARHGRERAKALREMERRKTVEFRLAWKAQADAYRKRYQQSSTKLEKKMRRLVGGRLEYELAVKYEPRKGRKK